MGKEGTPVSIRSKLEPDEVIDVAAEERLTGGWSSSYYVLPEDAKEIDDLIAEKHMSFRVGNIFKAAYRLGNKPGVDPEYDLEKIIWFAERELFWIRKNKP